MATLKSAAGDASTCVRTSPASALMSASLRPTPETRRSETGPSEPYDEYPVPGFVVRERIIVIPPFADVQTEAAGCVPHVRPPGTPSKNASSNNGKGH